MKDKELRKLIGSRAKQRRLELNLTQPYVATKPILRIRKNYRFVMQWAIFSNSYLSTLVKRKMLFPKIYCC